MLADLAAANARREAVKHAVIDEVRRMPSIPPEIAALLVALDKATEDFAAAMERHVEEEYHEQ